MNEDWVRRKLSDIAEVTGGGTPATKVSDYWGGDIVWLSPTEVVRSDGRRISHSERTLTESGLANSSAKLLPRGTVLVTSRASVGFTAIADAPLATNQGFQSLVPGPTVLSEFLMYWVQANREEFTSRASGSTFAEISRTKVAGIPIVLPPLRVQERIVDLMSALDTHIANLEAERDAGVLLSGEVLASALSTDADPMLVSARLGDCMALDVDRVRVNADEEYRIAGLLNAGKGFIDNGTIRGSQTNYSHLNRLREGQVVMRRLTAWEGPISVVPRAMDDTFASNEFPTFTVDETVMAAQFFRHVCKWPGLWREMRQRVTGTVQRRKRLSVEQLLDVSIPLPILDRQVEVARVLDSLELNAQYLDAETRALRDVRAALLSRLLSREVELPESYDELLDVAS